MTTTIVPARSAVTRGRAGLLVAAVVFGAPLLGTPAAVATPPAPVVQHQTGLAFGATTRSFAPQPRATDAGTYATTGQLGRGRYAFDLAVDTSLCTRTGDRMLVNGTAALTRADGTKLTGTVSGTEACFADDDTPATLGVSLTAGSRDLVGARLTFTGSFALHLTPGGEAGTESFAVTGTSSARPRLGYWMVGTTGHVFAFGGVDDLGDAPTTAVVDIEPTPTRAGYWVVDARGHVFAFGDARWFGNLPTTTTGAPGPVTSMSATPTGAGYWLFTTAGRVVPFGDARSFGDLGGRHLNGAIVGSTATPTGQGYYMVAADGGVFAFGDARFRGSMGATPLQRPVIGLVPTADNAGYWLVATDGGVFSFHAPFAGSLGAVALRGPVVGMVRYGTGYLLVGRDGGIFDFSRLPFFGSLGASPPADPIVAATAAG